MKRKRYGIAHIYLGEEVLRAARKAAKKNNTCLSAWVRAVIANAVHLPPPVIVNGEHPTHNPEHRAAILRWHAAHIPKRQLAKELGITNDRIEYVLKRYRNGADREFDGCNPIPRGQIHAILAWKAGQKKLPQLCRELGITVRHANSILDRYKA